MKLNSLQALYKDHLKDLYSAEQQLIKALPKMAKSASSPQLKNAFQMHLEQTKSHAERIERLFQDLDGSPRGKKCKGMEGLIMEGEEMIKEDADPDVKDAGLIAAAQRVEHYEIAGYGTVRTYAQVLGMQEHARMLQQILDEEGNTDKKLTQLAESGINLEAASGA
jgi:ferritin-like metal-binding protein YciE